MGQDGHFSWVKPIQSSDKKPCKFADLARSSHRGVDRPKTG